MPLKCKISSLVLRADLGIKSKSTLRATRPLSSTQARVIKGGDEFSILINSFSQPVSDHWKKTKRLADLNKLRKFRIKTYVLEHQEEHTKTGLSIKGKVKVDSITIFWGEVRTGRAVDIIGGTFSSALEWANSKVSRTVDGNRHHNVHIRSELRQIRLGRRKTDAKYCNEYEYNHIARRGTIFI